MKKLILILLFFLMTGACPFFLGNWKIIREQQIEFKVDKDFVFTFVEKGGILRMRHNIESLTEDICLELEDLQLVKRPSDWYNIKKYGYAIPLVQKLKREKLLIRLRIIDESTILAKPIIGSDETIESFQLIRMNKTGGDT